MISTDYVGVTTRFLRPEERLIVAMDNQMPLVIEAKESTQVSFLKDFLNANSSSLLEQISTYGAVLLRGFDIASDQDFEASVLSIQGLNGISDVFMSEEGRTQVGDSQFVLHTNAVYKTGGTLYLGGFHTENYYSPDVPGYICFCCLEPSTLGGETGLVHAEKLYQQLSQTLKDKLEKQAFFASKWLVSVVAERYQVAEESVEKICKHFDLPIVGEGKERFIVMYKPSVVLDPKTQKKSLELNLFELLTLNAALRRVFAKDYKGKTWFWHRLVWKLPNVAFKALEVIYIMCASFFHSPKESLALLMANIKTRLAARNPLIEQFNRSKVGPCFTEEEVQILAQLIRANYSSCLWKKGDILLVDNLKVMHAGMPGSGPRTIRALICNPIEMAYSSTQPGCIETRERRTGTIGSYMSSETLSNLDICPQNQGTSL